MGFTWEVDIHLYLTRAWVLDTAFGSVDVVGEAISEKRTVSSSFGVEKAG